jgi:hypothetical protein
MKLFFLQNPVNSGIFSMKNPLRTVKSYFPGQKLEKVRPPQKKPFMRFKKKREFVTKYSVSRKLCPGLVIFHQEERLWRTLKCRVKFVTTCAILRLSWRGGSSC